MVSFSMSFSSSIFINICPFRKSEFGARISSAEVANYIHKMELYSLQSLKLLYLGLCEFARLPTESKRLLLLLFSVIYHLQALLKITKHCKESAPNLVTGQLLGLDIGSVLEVTNCFPFPVSAAIAMPLSVCLVTG